MHARTGELIGVMGIGWRNERMDDIRHLRSVADLIGNAVALAVDTDRDRAMAAALQEMLLPPQLDEIEPARVAVRYRAVDRSVGGDFYDVVSRQDDCTWLVIGDVIGHGIGASRTMGKIRFFLRAVMIDLSDPVDVLEQVNRLLIAEDQGEMATCVVACWNSTDDVVTIASAGHLPQIVVAGGEVLLLDIEPAPPLGVERNSDVPASMELAVGDGLRLLLFTDGLIERRDEPLDRSLARLRGALATHAARDVDDTVDALLATVAGTDDDDIALLCIDIG
jgi:serine phosphatase RsbU (regulator of sigma subunit)